jgi:hypothetical protein
MMKPKFPRSDKISNPVVEYKRKATTFAATQIAEEAAEPPPPPMPALRATLGERQASRGRS